MSRAVPPPLSGQVFYCWSRRCDAILEVECTGRWREVYDRLRAAGVTDRELVGAGGRWRALAGGARAGG